MLRSACRALGDRGAPHVDLKVRAGNPAIALYLSEGFRPVPESA
jgi:ribosomal protein S18 acetylase RimI-like enzyme